MSLNDDGSGSRSSSIVGICEAMRTTILTIYYDHGGGGGP